MSACGCVTEFVVSHRSVGFINSSQPVFTEPVSSCVSVHLNHIKFTLNSDGKDIDSVTMEESSRALQKGMADFGRGHDHDDQGGTRENSGSDDDELFQATEQKFSLYPRQQNCPPPALQPGPEEPQVIPAGTVMPHKLHQRLNVQKMEWDEDRKAYRTAFFNEWGHVNNTNGDAVTLSGNAGMVVFYGESESPTSTLITKEDGNWNEPGAKSLRLRVKDPTIEIQDVYSKPFNICALCGPRSAFENQQLLKSHLEAVHMKGIQREYEILGCCPKCKRSNSYIVDLKVHLAWCYSLGGFTLDSDCDSSWDHEGQNKLEGQVLQKVVYDEGASTPTGHALNELAKYIQENPDAVKMDLKGSEAYMQSTIRTPEAATPIRCEIKCSDLRYCLESADGDVVNLTKRLTACVFGSKVGRVANPRPALEREINCIIGFILKHFGCVQERVDGADLIGAKGERNTSATKERLRGVVVELFRKGRDRAQKKFKSSCRENAARPNLSMQPPLKHARGVKIEEPNLPLTPTTPTAQKLRISIFEWDPTKGMYRIKFMNSWLNDNSARECFVIFSNEEPFTHKFINSIYRKTCRITTKIPNAEIDSSEWNCAPCRSTSTSTSPESKLVHLLTVHMDGLQKAFEIIGQCPGCQTPKTQIGSFRAHAIVCYAQKYTTAHTEPVPLEATPSRTGKAKFKVDVKRMFEILQFNGQGRISTEHELEDVAQYRALNLGSLTVEVGIEHQSLCGYKIRCEIKYLGLPSVISSVDEYITLKDERHFDVDSPLSALAAEIDCAVDFLAHHFTKCYREV